MKEAKENDDYNNVNGYLRWVLTKGDDFIKKFFSYRDGGCLINLFKSKQTDMIEQIIQGRDYIFDIIINLSGNELKFGQFISLFTTEAPVPKKYNTIKVLTILNMLVNFKAALNVFLHSTCTYNDKPINGGDTYDTLINEMRDHDTKNDFFTHLANEIISKIETDKTLVLNDHETDIHKFLKAYDDKLGYVYDADFNALQKKYNIT